MTRRRYVVRNGEVVEVPLDYIAEPRTQTHQVMPDIKPYKSMVTGEEIGSRSTHREHLRQHGMFEVGNEVKYLTKRQPTEPRLTETLIRVTKQKLGRM